MIEQKLQKMVPWAIFWAIFVSAGGFVMLTAGILLQSQTISWACMWLVYPAYSRFFVLYKLMKIKKEVSREAAAGSSDEMRSQPTTCSHGIRVEALSEPYFRGTLAVMNHFIGSGRKRLCGLIPLTLVPVSSSDFLISFATRNARSATAIAVRESDNKVVGFAQMSDSSMVRDATSAVLHPLKEKECYIEMMSVLPDVRGQGIGNRLLQWCEARARERGAQTLTLAVVARNPAKRLYERFGFVDKDEGMFRACVGSLVIFGIFGFPHCGCGGSTMSKNLEALG